MNIEDFRDFLDKVPTSTDIHFSGFTEPWHNPDCMSMILYAHSKGHDISVFTTGFGMRKEHIMSLQKIPFKKFSIHLPDADGFMKTKFDSDYLNLLIALLFSTIQNLDFFTIGKPHPKIVEIIGHHPFTNRIHTRANTLNRKVNELNTAISQVVISERIKGKSIICRKNRMYSNVLLPNGDVYLCCMDYSLKHKIGNLKGDNSYDDIFASKEFQSFLKAMNDPQSNIICRSCEYAIPGTYDFH